MCPINIQLYKLSVNLAQLIDAGVKVSVNEVSKHIEDGSIVEYVFLLSVNPEKQIPLNCANEMMPDVNKYVQAQIVLDYSHTAVFNHEENGLLFLLMNLFEEAVCPTA